MSVALGMAVFSGMTWRPALDQALRHGYASLDVQLDSDSQLTRSLIRDGVDRFREYATHQGLKIVCLSNVRDAELLLGPHSAHTDAMCAGSRDDKVRHALEWCMRIITWAGELDVPHIRLYFGCTDHLLMFPWYGYESSWHANVAAFVEGVAEIMDFAANHNVTVCVETHPRLALFRMDAWEEAHAQLAGRGHRLGLCFDPANVMAGGLDPYSYLEALSVPPQIVHVKDVEMWSASTPPPGDGWRRYGPGALSRFRDFGHGKLDWPGIGRILTRRGFDGTFVAEFEDPTVTVAESLARTAAPLSAWIAARR
jgi:sugar phosphate isomerase/epimerase